MQNRRGILLFALLLVAPSFATASAITGETVVRSISPQKIAVLVDTNGDQLIDRGFLLSVDIPAGEVSARFPSATIHSGEGYVRVASENRIYDLLVAGYPDPPPAESGSRVVTLIGYSLVNSSGDSGCDIQRAAERDAGACFAYARD